MNSDSPWFALYTRSRHEKRVAKGLEQRGLENYLPLVPRVSQWHDRKKTVYWALFPGYVFARCAQSGLAMILTVPGVVSVVSVTGLPATIPNDEIENIRTLVDAIARTGSVPKAEVLIREGEMVEVTDGAFRGVLGRVLEQRGSRITLQAGLSAIGHGVRLEVPHDSVRIVGEASDSR